MDRIYVRTCSATQAVALSRGKGQLARIGRTSVLIYPPTGMEPIARESSSRYLARVEVLVANPEPDPPVDADVAKVLCELFGPYLP
jgi:hypothetical protein